MLAYDKDNAQIRPIEKARLSPTWVFREILITGGCAHFTMYTFYFQLIDLDL